MESTATRPVGLPDDTASVTFAGLGIGFVYVLLPLLVVAVVLYLGRRRNRDDDERLDSVSRETTYVHVRRDGAENPRGDSHRRHAG